MTDDAREFQAIQDMQAELATKDAEIERLIDLARRSREELRLIYMKDSGAIYDVTLRLDLTSAVNGIPDPAGGMPVEVK